MTRNQAMDAVTALERRCGIVLSHSGWQAKKMPGGVAMDRDAISALSSAARRYGDEKATVYEMESVNQEFPPVDVELSYEGLRKLRAMMMAHFDLLLVPESRRWVVLLSNELESIFFGTEEFLAAVTNGGGE